jgi:crotonobetaine/carnitine-CoA ligase
MATSKLNFGQWFEEKVDLGKNLPFIWFKDEMFTYEQVNFNVNRVSNALYELGVRKGSMVALIMSNCPEFIYCWFGLAKIGAVTLFVNVDMKAESLRDLLISGDADYIIIKKDRWKNYLTISKSLSKIKNIISVPDKQGIDDSGNALSFEQIYKASSHKEPPEISFDNGEPMGFIHTAGTTGPPKWAILSHKAYITSGETLREWSMTNYTDIFYDPLPLFHINPQTYFLMNALTGNASVVITERYSASNLWREVCRYKATILVLHIAPMAYALKQPVVPEETQHRLRMIAIGAWRPVMERFRIPVGGGGYGSTELPGFITLKRFYLPISKKWDYLGDKLDRYTGKPVDYVEVKIFGEDDNEMPVGEVGEIVVRGKEPHVIFDGYYNMPEKNKEAFRSGWFHTGDAGKLDKDGNLIFEGRKAESINVKGEWIPIDEVETAIRSYPNVVEVAIVGVPTATGQDLKACVQVSEGHNIDPIDLLDYCQTKLARFMIPRYIEFVQEFPRTLGTEKIQRQILKEKGIGNAWDREKAGYKLKR